MDNPNRVLWMTPSEQIKLMHGNPKESARKVQHGFLQRVVWEYRGYRMLSRKKSGWGTGSDWFPEGHPTRNLFAGSKLSLMLAIDRELDKAGA